MKRIASPDDPAEPKDKHYIAIDMKKLSEIIDNMINKGMFWLGLSACHFCNTYFTPVAKIRLNCLRKSANSVE